MTRKYCKRFCELNCFIILFAGACFGGKRGDNILSYYFPFHSNKLYFSMEVWVVEIPISINLRTN